jgi:polar amino acid transport system permease protein
VKFLHRIDGLRPANLLLLLALPFLIWLFATSTDYTRSLAAIIWAWNADRPSQFPGLLLCSLSCSRPRSPVCLPGQRWLSPLATLGIGAGLALCLTPLAHSRS